MREQVAAMACLAVVGLAGCGLMEGSNPAAEQFGVDADVLDFAATRCKEASANSIAAVDYRDATAFFDVTTREFDACAVAWQEVEAQVKDPVAKQEMAEMIDAIERLSTFTSQGWDGTDAQLEQARRLSADVLAETKDLTRLVKVT